MKKIMLFMIALFVVVSSSVLKAETYVYPADNPSFSITFPDSWKVEAADKDLSASPKDESIFLLLSVFEKADNLDEAVDNLDSELSSILSEIEVGESEIVEMNDIKFLTVDGSGLHEDVEVLFSVAVFKPDDDNVFLMIYLGTEEAENEHADELESVVTSIKAQ